MPGDCVCDCWRCLVLASIHLRIESNRSDHAALPPLLLLPAPSRHPDKNSDPSAQSRFLQINEAYEILTNSDKKADFDRYGTVRSKQQREQEEAQRAFFAQQRAQQAQWASAGGRGYGYGFADQAYLNRQNAYLRGDEDAASGSVRLTGANWEFVLGSVTSQSKLNEGWIIYVHSGTCEPCQTLSPTFAFMARTVRRQFGGLVRTARINAEFESALVRRFGIQRLPTVLAIVTTPAGESSRSTMQLGRDSRGSLLVPTVAQLLDFAFQVIYPTQKEGRPSASVPVPCFDITAGLAQHKDNKAAALALRTRIANLQSEFGEYPNARTHMPVSPFVHLYVLSRHAHPTPLTKFLAHKFASSVRFAHVSLPMLAHSGTMMAELAAAFPGVDLPRSVTEGSLLLVQRETSLRRFDLLTADARRVEEELAPVAEVAAMVAPWTALHVPRLDGSNFFPLCYPKFVAGLSSASAQATPSAHRECFILLTDTLEQAHKILLPLFPSNKPASPASAAASATADSGTAATAVAGTGTGQAAEEEFPAVPRHIQLGWMNPREQPGLIAFFRTSLARTPAGKALGGANAPLHGVLLRARDSTFAILPVATVVDGAPDTRRVAAWLQSASAASAGSASASSPKWIDGRGINGGLPYPLTIGSPSALAQAGRQMWHLFKTPFRWLGQLTGLGGSSITSSNEGGNSGSLLLVLLFTIVFLVATTSMLQIVN